MTTAMMGRARTLRQKWIQIDAGGIQEQCISTRSCSSHRFDKANLELTAGPELDMHLFIPTEDCISKLALTTPDIMLNRRENKTEVFCEIPSPVGSQNSISPRGHLSDR